MLDVQVADRAGNVTRGNTRGGVRRAAQPRRVLRRLTMRAGPRPRRSRRSRSCALGGCGLGAGPALGRARAAHADARLRRRRRSRDRKIDDVPESETVMRLLQRNARRQDALRRRLRAVHRRPLRRGVAETSTGSTSSTAARRRRAPRRRACDGGDRIWWDRRDWTATQRDPGGRRLVPRAVRARPGNGKRLPVRVECADLESAPCSARRATRSSASASRPRRARCGARSPPRRCASSSGRGRRCATTTRSRCSRTGRPRAASSPSRGRAGDAIALLDAHGRAGAHAAAPGRPDRRDGGRATTRRCGRSPAPTTPASPPRRRPSANAACARASPSPSRPAAPIGLPLRRGRRA